MASLNKIESGTPNLTDGNGFVESTISSVDTTKCIFWSSSRVDAGAGDTKPDRNMLSGRLSSATKVRYDIGDTVHQTITNRFFVSEFASGVSSQRGVLSPGSTGINNITISSVNISSSWVSLSVSTNTGAFTYDENCGALAEITSSTNLRITIGDSTGINEIAWEVIEFTGASVQLIKSSITTETTDDTTISSVNLSRSIVICAGIQQDTTSDIRGQEMLAFHLTSTTNLRSERYSAGDMTYHIYVVEFPSDVSVQSGFETTTTDTLDKTITAIDLTKTVAFLSSANWQNNSMNRNASDHAEMFRTSVLSSTTNLRLQRTTGPTEQLLAWFVVSFTTTATDDIKRKRILSRISSRISMRV